MLSITFEVTLCRRAIPITIEAARGLYEAGGGHGFDHVLRVLAMGERIARAEGADMAVVRTAALLHDIGESQGRAGHHLRGAALARERLAELPPAFVEAVAHAIEAHRFRAGPRPATLEAQVVSDADKLDAIGAIGVARVFAYAGAHGAPLWRTPWPLIVTSEAAGQRNLHPRRRVRLQANRIPEHLYTPTAQVIAAGRRAFMQAFFDRLDAEAASG